MKNLLAIEIHEICNGVEISKKMWSFSNTHESFISNHWMLCKRQASFSLYFLNAEFGFIWLFEKSMFLAVEKICCSHFNLGINKTMPMISIFWPLQGVFDVVDLKMVKRRSGWKKMATKNVLENGQHCTCHNWKCFKSHKILFTDCINDMLAVNWVEKKKKKGIINLNPEFLILLKKTSNCFDV